MTLTHDDVTRIAYLARIEVTPGEAAAVQAKLQSIFGLIDSLLAIDTTGVEPMSHAQDATLPLRDDAVTDDGSQHARHQALAPAIDDGLYLVPRVIE